MTSSQWWKSSAKLYITLLITYLSAQPTAHAQAFEYIDVGVQVSQPQLQDNSYASRWELTQSNGVSISTPFYIGHVGLSAAYFDYEPKNDAYAFVESVNYAANFGYTFRDAKIFSIKTMLGVGIQKTILIGDNYDNNADERELYYTSFIEPTLSLGKLAIYGHIEYTKVFNYERQHILHLGLGIRYRIPLPNRIQSFID